MSALFSPIQLRALTLANRITVSPMCQYSAVARLAGDWHLMHSGQFAVAGAGMLVIEATHVEPRGRITHGCLGLYSDENEAALARVVAFCHTYGSCRIGMQLSHSGRKGSATLPWERRGMPLTPAEGAWPTVGCSGLPFFGRLAGAGAARCRRHPGRDRRPRRGRRSGQPYRRGRCRTPCRAWISAARVLVAAQQSAPGRLRWVTGEPDASEYWRFSRLFAQDGPLKSRWERASQRPTGLTAAGRSTTQ